MTALSLGPQLDAPEFAAFWAGCRNHRLLVRRCGNSHLAWPPRPACPECGDLTQDWQEVEGKGRLYSWTVIHRTSVTELTSLLPFAVGIVSLDQQPRIRFLGRCLSDATELYLGAEMEIVFETVDERLTLPLWRLRDGR